MVVQVLGFHQVLGSFPPDRIPPRFVGVALNTLQQDAHAVLVVVEGQLVLARRLAVLRQTDLPRGQVDVILLPAQVHGGHAGHRR